MCARNESHFPRCFRDCIIVNSLRGNRALCLIFIATGRAYVDFFYFLIAQGPSRARIIRSAKNNSSVCSRTLFAPTNPPRAKNFNCIHHSGTGRGAYLTLWVTIVSESGRSKRLRHRLTSKHRSRPRWFSTRSSPFDDELQENVINGIYTRLYPHAQ